jgi:hypothetical protein
MGAFAALEKVNREAEALDDACGFWRSYLAGGPQPADETLKAAKAHGHAKKTLARARKKVGVLTEKTGLDGGWMLSLPTLDGASDVEGPFRGEEAPK